MSFLKEYSAYCEAHGVPDRLELLLCDVNAILRGKWLPGEEARKLSEGSVRLPMSTYAPNILGYDVEGAGLGITVGDPDGNISAIDGTLRKIPWLNGNIAQVLVELRDDDGEISDLSPRHHLQRMVARFAARGLTPVVATELEFYIIQKRERSEDIPLAPVRSPRAQNYDMEMLHRLEPILTDILTAAAFQDLPTGTLIAEYGPGQFEVNFNHTSEVLQSADHALMFKRLVRGIAGNHGMEATFMAKPYAEHPGNGMHVHVSVLDNNGRNIFDDGGAEVSETLRHAVGGVLQSMPEMQAIFSPHLNSMRRFRPNEHAATATEWGIDHRGAAVRIPEVSGKGARLEHRISGADVNPYLVLTAVLGGILHGLDNKTDPGPALVDEQSNNPEAEKLATDWAACVDRFETSDFAENFFGQNYRHVYTEVRRDEISELTSIISPIEYRYYLSRF